MQSLKIVQQHNNYVNLFLIRILIIIIIAVNAYGMWSVVLASNDSNYYAVIAKNIVITNDWINLRYAGLDWLDKPHIPFWLTAISFKILGFYPLSYILPGFIFHIIGGYYTYLLGKYLYTKEVGEVAALLYFSSLHLMLSSIDVRAEAFLLGEIIPASYYWLLYNDCQQVICKKYLIFGAVFTALAVMTKGIFTVVTIISGTFGVWLYTKKHISNYFNRKWLYAIALSFILIVPELVCLYLQFDLHPEKIVLGKTDVSGIRFFFWDSQFGRFFNFGPYISWTHDPYSHYFYFIHTFLWAFLPWSTFFIASLYMALKLFKSGANDEHMLQCKRQHIFLLFSFFTTFILFSLTTFQLDHYTNIIMPFAAILCSYLICDYPFTQWANYLLIIQMYIGVLLLSIVLLLSFFLLGIIWLLQLVIIFSIIITLYWCYKSLYRVNEVITCSTISIALAFIFVIIINNKIYPKYDIGYQVANFLGNKSQSKVIDYNLNSSSLEFHLPINYSYVRSSSAENLYAESHGFYLVAKSNINDYLLNNRFQLKLLKVFKFIPQEKFIESLFRFHGLDTASQRVLLYSVTPLKND